jgi:hypothetical protein
MVVSSDTSSPAAEQRKDAGCLITHERGPMTRQVHAAALAWGGEAAWATLLARVSPACRERFAQSVGFFEWVPSPLALELHRAWADLRGEDTMGERGEAAAREMLGGIQAWILRSVSPSFLMANVGRIFTFYYRGGRLDLVRQDPEGVVFELLAEGYPEAWYHEGLPAWIKVALDLTRCHDVRIVHDPHADGRPELHRYQVLWRS